MEMEFSQARYDYGYTSCLEVIIAQDNLFGVELEESATRAQR